MRGFPPFCCLQLTLANVIAFCTAFLHSCWMFLICGKLNDSKDRRGWGPAGGSKSLCQAIMETGRMWEVVLAVVWSLLKNIYTAELGFTTPFYFLKGLSCFVCWRCVLRINCESLQGSGKPWIWYCSPRVLEVHQLWILTEILISVFYSGNEGKINVWAVWFWIFRVKEP